MIGKQMLVVVWCIGVFERTKRLNSGWNEKCYRKIEDWRVERVSRIGEMVLSDNRYK